MLEKCRRIEPLDPTHMLSLREHVKPYRNVHLQAFYIGAKLTLQPPQQSHRFELWRVRSESERRFVQDRGQVRNNSIENVLRILLIGIGARPNRSLYAS